VLRRLFGRKRNEVLGGWRKFHKEGCMEARRNACKILFGNPEVKRPFGRPRCRWEYNIKMDLREVRLECVD
jgi:hypothetical protein